MTTRRAFLAGVAATGLAWGPIGFAAAPTERRLVVLTLRGGLDGLAAVVPHGDPHYAVARGSLALGRPGTEGGPVDLDGMFGLHPALADLLPLWTAGELLPLHAVAIPSRTRSHFEAQNVLDTGLDTPYASDSGWLARALAALDGAPSGVALGPQLPLSLRGAAPATSIDPGGSDPGSEEFLDRLAALYEDDALLGPALAEGRSAMGMVDAAGIAAAGRGRDLGPVVRLMAEVLRPADGPRVAVAALDGWDTHQNEGTGTGRLPTQLATLARVVVGIRDAQGPAWAHTAVLVVTEFGRTVKANGTSGTDHGTGAVALLAGGAVSGGRVVADWPGLGAAALLDGRDLAPTRDLRAVYKAIARDHLGVPEGAVEDAVIPGCRAVEPLAGLFRA